MKAKVLMLTLLGAFALSFGAQAQQEVSTSQNLSGHKTIYNRDGSRWFIDIQGGAVMLPLGEANNKAEFMDRVSLGMPMLLVHGTILTLGHVYNFTVGELMALNLLMLKRKILISMAIYLLVQNSSSSLT